MSDSEKKSPFVPPTPEMTEFWDRIYAGAKAVMIEPKEGIPSQESLSTEPVIGSRAAAETIIISPEPEIQITLFE